MSKTDTWPGGVAMESLSNMNSAGSCDSVISSTSGFSEDSMEHLSAEERACLMYLEETIEALEVQEDSGLSNDEPDPLLTAGKRSRMAANDFHPDEGQNDKSEWNTLKEASKSSPSSATHMKNVDASVNLTTQAELPLAKPAAGSKMDPPPHQSHQPKVFYISKDEDGNLKIVSDSGQPSQVSEMDLSLIPPPSDFMDEPRRRPRPDKSKDPPISAGTVDLELLRQRASMKGISSVTPELPNQAPELNPVGVSSGPPVSPSHETAEPKSPPAVAPKPKKLPANIILKSHRAAVPDSSSGHLVPTSSDRLMLDPQRVRIEALRKLGLLKNDEVDAGPIVSPKHSPQTRRSWAAPSSPVSPAPHTPPTTPSYTCISTPPPSQSPVSGSSSALSTPAAVQTHIVPAPAAFSDRDGPLQLDKEGSTPPCTPPLIKQLTPPKDKNVTSSSLESSGLGLSSYMDSQDPSEEIPSQLPNRCLHPGSLGSGIEFSAAEGASSLAGHAASKEPHPRQSLPAYQHSENSQKLPRSHGISVLIRPRSENGNEHREALKRLGLLRN